MSKKSPVVFPMQTRKETMVNYLCIAGIAAIITIGSGFSFGQLMALLELVLGKG